MTVSAATATAVLQLGGMGVVAIAIGVVVVVLGAVIVATDIGPGSETQSHDEPTSRSQTETSATDTSATGPSATETSDTSTESISQSTLDRLDRLAPDAVDRVEAQQAGGTGITAEQKRELYRGIEDAIADGKLDMNVTSRYGTAYEIVNLPSHLREIEFSMFEGRYHVHDIEDQILAWVDDDTSLRELSFAVDEAIDHRSSIERYIDKRESEFQTLVSEIESDITPVRNLCEQLGDGIGDRIRTLVVESRHSEFDGITTIEADIETAKTDLHTCSFDDAVDHLRELQTRTNELLTAVEFVRSLTGGIEHGQQSARIPNETARELYVELEGLLARTYDVSLSVENNRVMISQTKSSDTSKDRDTSTSPPTTEPTTETTTETTTRQTVSPDAVTDEILYIFRELRNGTVSGNSVEYQTENLPESIAQPDVLQELASFCRRHSETVESVTLQDGAPPGFLEIQFVENTTVDAGLDRLRDVFTDRYGS